MIVLRTRGCEYARRTGGCSVCGFIEKADDQIDDAMIVAQLDAVLLRSDLEDVGQLDLLTLGSFLNDREISPSLRRELLGRLDRLPSLRRISIESRAEHITIAKLQEVKAQLGDRIVELAIGLESADDHIRNTTIRKDLSKEAFLEVVEHVESSGLHLLVYLLIKPPGLTEGEAITDAVASARFVFAAAEARGVAARIAFEPVFVCRNTELEELFRTARYRLVNLWSVVDVIGQVHGEGEVFVGLSDEDLATDRTSSSCERCAPRIIHAIESYNASQDLEGLRGLWCDCREGYRDRLSRGEL